MTSERLGETINRRATAGASFADALNAMDCAGRKRRAMAFFLVLGAAAEYELWRESERAWERYAKTENG